MTIMSKIPYLVFIGPGRSGTSFVDSVLRQDQRLVFPRHQIKETNHFLSSSSLASYSSFFPDIQGTKVEVTNMYCYSARAEENLRVLPEGSLLVSILRNPFDRLMSSLQYRVSVGEIPWSDLGNDVFEKYPDLLQQSLYYSFLSPYFINQEERIRVLYFDDLIDEPQRFIDNVYRLLDIPSVPLDFKAERNSARAPRSPFAARALRMTSDFLRNLGCLRLLNWGKRSSLVRSIFFGNDSLDLDSISIPDRYISLINEDIRMLSTLLGRDLSKWEMR